MILFSRNRFFHLHKCYSFSLTYYRLLNLTCLKFSKKFRNPFQRRIFSDFFKDNAKEVTRICATILGNGALGQPRCIGLFNDHKGILFNCGEGVGRLLREYETHFHLIKYAFITKNEWCNVSGLNDIHLTHEAYGISKLNLFGPPGVENFRYFNTAFVQSAKLIKRNTPYRDDTFEINSISIFADPPPTDFKKTRRRFNNKTSIEDVVFSYVCKILEKPSELVPEKLVEHNVPFGPHLLKLKNGEDVTLPSGRTIHSADVVGELSGEEILLIVDCPSENFLLPFVTEEKFSLYQLPSDVASKVSTIFHFSPPNIINRKIYQEWMNRFHSNVQHVILNESCPNTCSEAIYQTQNIFHFMHPEIFKLLPKSKAGTESLQTTSNILQAPPMLQLYFYPKKTINWNNVVNCELTDVIEETKYFPNFIEVIKNLKSLITSKTKAISQDYPEVVFLGTCSSTSSAYRNVSVILLKVDSSSTFVLDCGEGAFMQFSRYFGSEKVHTELRKISCIFVSHLHTDHYLGIFQLVKERIEAFKKTGHEYKPLALILPYRIREIFLQFSEIFEPLASKVRIFTCKSVTSKSNKSEKLQSFLGDVEIETVPVKHCLDAYGIVLKKGSKWKIVYSGDSAPCQTLIDAGENCDLLIHEASIEDGFVNEAMDRKHSTPSQVIDISEKMNAQYTIMTHFSKRYLAIPVFDESNKKSVGFAFDFMTVKLHQLPLIPLFIPAMKCLFQDQLEEHSERTSYVANFENSFLRSYKNQSKH